MFIQMYKRAALTESSSTCLQLWGLGSRGVCDSQGSLTRQLCDFIQLLKGRKMKSMWKWEKEWKDWTGRISPQTEAASAERLTLNQWDHLNTSKQTNAEWHSGCVYLPQCSWSVPSLVSACRWRKSSPAGGTPARGRGGLVSSWGVGVLCGGGGGQRRRAVDTHLLDDVAEVRF